MDRWWKQSGRDDCRKRGEEAAPESIGQVSRELISGRILSGRGNSQPSTLSLRGSELLAELLSLGIVGVEPQSAGDGFLRLQESGTPMPKVAARLTQAWV